MSQAEEFFRGDMDVDSGNKNDPILRVESSDLRGWYTAL